MKLTYQLTLDDLVKFNIYHTENSPIHIKARRRYRIIPPAIYLALAMFGYFAGDVGFAMTFAGLAIVWFLFSPRILKRRYRKHFEKHVEENFKDSVKESSTVELEEDGVHSTSQMGESIFKYSAVEKIVANDGFTYVYIGKGMAIVIPHDRVPENQINDLVTGIEKQREDLAS